MLILTLCTLTNTKILKPTDKELVMSKPDQIEFITKPAKKHSKSSKIKLDSAKHKKKPSKRQTKKLRSHPTARKLYEKYDPKKYIRRYETYQHRVDNAKHHILGNKKIALSKKLHDIEAKKKMHEKMMHREHHRPNKFKVDMKKWKKKQREIKRRKARHLTKVVGDDAEELNELHTNEEDGDDKLESIPLLLVGDYEIIIEKK